MTTIPRKRKRRVIGWREWVGLPDLDVKGIKAKIDTGARTSAIHAWNIARHEEEGRQWVEFDLHPVQRENQTVISCRAPLIDMRTIRSSSGQTEHRYVIRTKLRLGGRTWLIDLSLTNRDEMGFRLLLGRAAVRRRVIVDPGRSFLIPRPDSWPD
ncbi:MAG: ATP-dependent zinc protease [Hyphomicrobiales bacterium]|nr:ATP-dependent zinc protease [Hyphomicrobiales bacterium]